MGITVDFGRVYYHDLGIRDASFAAARYAGMNPFDDPEINNAAINAAPSGVLKVSSITITAPVVSGCDGSRVSGSVTCSPASASRKNRLSKEKL